MKTTMGYHFIPVRTATVKKTTNNKHWQGCKEMHFRWECEMGVGIMKTVWGPPPQKLKTELPYDPVNPVLKQLF